MQWNFRCDVVKSSWHELTAIIIPLSFMPDLDDSRSEVIWGQMRPSLKLAECNSKARHGLSEKFGASNVTASTAGSAFYYVLLSHYIQAGSYHLLCTSNFCFYFYYNKSGNFCLRVFSEAPFYWKLLKIGIQSAKDIRKYVPTFQVKGFAPAHVVCI